MSKSFRTRGNNSSVKPQRRTTMADETTTKPVHESKRVKAVVNDGVKVETQTVDAKFGTVEGSITYPRCTATTPDGALAMAASLGLTKTVETKNADGTVTESEVKLDDQDAFLKYFNAGYDSAMRLTARNELAVAIEGPEKQINAVASRIAKLKFGDDSEENIKKVRALPEFNSLVTLMS